jgi:predicted phosphodiesterase
MAIEKILFFSDPHAPFENKPAVDLVLEVAGDWKPNHLACLGDLIDAYSVSSHSKDPGRKVNLVSEIDYAKELLDLFDDLAVPGRKIFTEGNHETRLQRYIADKAPQFDGLISIPQVLGLKERGWEFTPYRSFATLGKLTLTHDVGYAGRYAPHRTLDALQSSVVFGHTHRLGLLVESNLKGESKVACSFGWLGDLDAVDYMHKGKVTRDWSLGFGIGYLDTETGYVQLTPIPLLPYKKGLTCTVEGTAYVS